MTVMEAPEVTETTTEITETEAQLSEILETVTSSDSRITQQLRVVEAILFAASSPLDEKTIALHLSRGPIGEGADVPALLAMLKEQTVARGFDLLESSGRFSLRSAADLADYLKTETVKPVKLSRAMAETLAIIAYHQPVTRAEVETIRGVATSKGTLDYLMTLGWVRPGRRRETPGRPLTWITTPAFLDHFGLGSTNDLPGVDELRAAGLLDAQAATTYGVIAPSDEAELLPAIEGLVESEPEFMPSDETTAEAIRAVAEEETAVDDDAEDDSDEAEFDEDESEEMSEDDDFDDDDDEDEDDDEVTDEVEPADIDAEEFEKESA